VASGSHHTLALTECGKVYGWGDAESGKIGRMLNTRNKNYQALKIEKVGAKAATDIFCGNQHSFYINDKHQVFAWGLNNHGQLGTGNKFNSSVPTRIKDLDPYEGDYVVELAGGEHHSIARTKDGVVYCWGRNDEGQVACGDTYGEWRKEKAQKEMEAAEAARVAQEEADKLQAAQEEADKLA
jgi:regulator of chromosome condensation